MAFRLTQLRPALRRLPRRPISTASPPAATPPAPTSPEKSKSVIGLELPQTYPPAVLNALSLANASRAEKRRIRKQEIIEQYRRSESDTGSPEVQIAVLTDRIRDLTEHVVSHRQDKHNKRRLVNLVSQRRGLMRYLLKKDAKRYMALVTALGLRPSSVFSKDTSLGAKKAPTPKLH